MIPEDALEEAAKVLAFHLTDRAQDAGCALRCGYDGEEMPAHLAQHILEAAAPHMLAGVEAAAWEAGFDRGFYDPLAGSSKDASESLARNPYE